MSKKAPNGAPLRFVKQAVSHRGSDCLIWPYGFASHGYATVMWRGKIHNVHRVICILSHGEPIVGKNHAAHYCGNPSCCNPAHLRWATAKENLSDRVAHGTMTNGEKHGGAILTSIQVLEISARLDAGERGTDLAREYGVQKPAISRIKTGATWGHLTGRGS